MEFHKAAALGDIKRVTALVNSNYFGNEVDQYGNTALHLAKDPDIVSCLLNASVDINAKNVDGDTALNSWYKLNLQSPSPSFNFSASRDIMVALIDAGADCNVQNKLKQTVLHTLMVYGGKQGLSLTEEQLIELLTLVIIMGHADVNIADYEMCIPLHYAISESCPTIIEILLQSGSNANFQNIWGGTVLHLLGCIEDFELITTLLHNGADPCIQDHEGKTCLHSAASMGNYSAISIIMDFYLQQRASGDVKTASDSARLTDVKDVNGQTAIHLSAINKHIEATALLIAYNADVNATDNYGATCLHYGAIGGTIEIVEMLVNACADVSKCDCNGTTAIELAYERHYYETASAIERARALQFGICVASAEGTDKINANHKLCPADNIFTTYIHEASLYTDPFDLGHIDRALIEEMSIEFQGDFEKYLCEMVHVLGVGVIPQNEEVHEIQVAIENFIQRLVLTMSEIDDRFQGTLLKSGSWYEGTKVGDPNEFDFMLCLKEFEKFCSVEIKQDQVDGIIVSRKDQISEKFDAFFRNNELQSTDLMESFVLVAKRALSRLKYESNCRSLQVQGITEHSLIDATWLLPGTATCELKFTWTGATYKQLIITTDLVPAIYAGLLPRSSSLTSVAQELRETGCHVVSKSGNWRLSFSLAEKLIFDRLQSESKEAYIRAKIALHPVVSGRFFLVNPTRDSNCLVHLGESWDMSDKDDSQVDETFDGEGNDKSEMRQNIDVVRGSASAFQQGCHMVENIDNFTSSEVRDTAEESEIKRVNTVDTKFDHCNINHDSLALQKATNLEDGAETPTTGRYDAAPGNYTQGEGLYTKVICNTRLDSNETVAVLSFADALKEDEAKTQKMISDLSESGKVDIAYEIDGEDSNEIDCIDGRSLIPSYLLKLVMLNCIEKCNAKNTMAEQNIDTGHYPEAVVSTKQIFEEIQRCLRKKEPVPYFFCKKRDFLRKVVKSQELFCKISFIVSFICELFHMEKNVIVYE